MSALETPPAAAKDPKDERIHALEAEIEKLKQKIPLDPELIAKEARKRFLRFLVDRVNPGFMDRHRGDLTTWDREVFQEAGRLGLMGYNAPKELGGEGRSSAEWNYTLEELGKLIEDPGFLIIAQIQKNWAQLIHSLGRQDLVDRYARPMISGDHTLAWAMWEPADPSHMQSVAKKVEGGWKVFAGKPLTTGGWYATLFAIVVREEETDEQVLFLVEREDPGVQVDFLPTVGGHHVGYASLTLTDVFVPEDRLLVESDALAAASRVFNDGILNAAAVHMGWMQRIFGLCVSALRPKVRHGQSVLEIPHVQSELGRLYMGIETARSLFQRTVERYRQSENDPLAEPLTPIFKHFLTERALDTARTVMTLQGATGYMDNNPWGRYLTHAFGLLHAAGSQDLIPQQQGTRMLMELEMKRLRKVGF